MFWFEQFYALFTSLMVSAILLLGGSASISALTGMDIRAATMLLPTGVIAFVVVGGLRSTFISDFVVSETHSNRILHLLTHTPTHIPSWIQHTTIVFVIIWLFVYTVSMTGVFHSTFLMGCRHVEHLHILALLHGFMHFSKPLHKLHQFQETHRIHT